MASRKYGAKRRQTAKVFKPDRSIQYYYKPATPFTMRRRNIVPAIIHGQLEQKVNDEGNCGVGRTRIRRLAGLGSSHLGGGGCVYVCENG